jgi:hypothetical protein
MNAAMMQLTRDSTFGKNFNRLTTALVRTTEGARLFVFQQLSRACGEMTRYHLSFAAHFDSGKDEA